MTNKVQRKETNIGIEKERVCPLIIELRVLDKDYTVIHYCYKFVVQHYKYLLKDIILN